jgi:hypothetical protein
MKNIHIKCLFSSVLLIALAGCCLRGSGVNGHRVGEFALYSTKVPGGGLRFLIVPDLFVPRNATSYETSTLKSWPEVLQSFGGLGKKNSFVWRNAPEQGWTYPEALDRRNFIAAASNRSVEIIVLPGLLHSNTSHR